MRIVSLACSNTEIVCALGREKDLVGVDDHSDFPEEVVRRLPRVGPDLEIDVERVAELKPDLVLATLTVPGHERVVEALRRAGLPFLAPEPTSLRDVYANIREIGERLDAASEAEAVVHEMTRAVEPRATAAAASEPALSVLVQWWPKPVIAPGRLSWTHDLITEAGLVNPLGSEDVKSRPMTDEEVRGLDPAAIVLSWCGIAPENYRPEVVYSNPLWQDVAAVHQRRVVCIPEALLGRPSPRLIDGLEALRRIRRLF